MPHDKTSSHADRPVRKWNAAELTDTELMNELNASRCQDDRPLSVLRVRYDGLVLNVLRGQQVRGADAEEVSADVWFRVARLAQRGRWDPGRAVHTTDPFVPLLKRITRNLGRDFQRRASARRKRAQRLEQAARLFGDEWRKGASAAPRVRNRERPVACGVPAALVSVVGSLSENLRLAYELHARGIGCREIAKRVGCSPATAHRRVRQAEREISLLILKSRPAGP
jgi:DNA-directed RNA polymerase specialized sigma24 family protein